MNINENFEKIAISVKSHNLLKKLLQENSILEIIMQQSNNETEALIGVQNWVMETLKDNKNALAYYKGELSGHEALKGLKWKDYAGIRILDYIDHAGQEFEDLNSRGGIAVTNPIKMIWLAVKFGTGGGKPAFFEDMLHLFRQFSDRSVRVIPTQKTVENWMNRYPSGLDPRVVILREENRDRIINIIIDKIDKGTIKDKYYKFEKNMPRKQKFSCALDWWKTKRFHLRFAVRNPDDLNEMLGYSLDPDTMKILYDAKDTGIPFFVNPYYLSLLNVRSPYYAIGADLAIRDYILYSNQLVNEFGKIVAWEKEDKVEPGKPNAAGWVLPFHHSIHRRYPEVAIMIPDTMGRTCGGLCSSCQRMYDFQSGHLNFDLDKLKPNKKWSEKLKEIMEYFEKDAQLRDILITGGDALMSSDASLKKILDAVYDMASRKRSTNKKRKSGKKYAEIIRIRLGTRLPVYLPQRMTPELIKILSEFKKKAVKIGMRQFVIQTHFESPMEITPESKDAIDGFLSAGWIVTNQLVLSAAASRRGHTAKLRQALNDVGVLPYYNFTVKGYMENSHNFATNARSVQEQMEEKVYGLPQEKFHGQISEIPEHAESTVETLCKLREEMDIPFLATDRNVLNLPGVGKSLTFRVIGITRHGRRIIEFDHDATRNHSPIINKMGKVIIIESKSINEYIQQLSDMGESVSEYETVFGYSIGETEPRMPLYEYPAYNFKITDEMTNLEID
ncbi:l-lysine 2,3-aminomutase [Candidatus Magnetomorum sp. HK-1]|nr:l-lysine 2,3-aminomutase [Candidatus Magnetomorum sp. HK-1]